MTALTLVEPTTQARLISAEEFAVLDDRTTDNVFELVRGKVVTRMSPGVDHGAYEMKIGAALLFYLRTHKLGHVSGGEARILTRRNPDTVRMADVLYISYERLGGREFAGTLTVAPELVVEVVSPDDRWGEISEKLDEYFEAGVLVVWMVEPKLRRVRAYTSPDHATTYGMGESVPGGEILPGFELVVGDVFG